MSNDNNTRSTAGIVLKAANYFRIEVGYRTVLVPANAKTIEAYNTLFGDDALFLDTSWDDAGEYFQIEQKSSVISASVQGREFLQPKLRDLKAD